MGYDKHYQPLIRKPNGLVKLTWENISTSETTILNLAYGS